MYFNIENIPSEVSKQSEKKFFWSLQLRPRVKWLKNWSFFDFFETMIKMISILKYIGQIEILADKNYLGCFRRISKFKKLT
jgi:hypothetical protein